VLLTRRTINEFELTFPDNWDATLQNAIQAATFAPNHKRTEPWRFHLLGPESIRKVCELNAKLISAGKGKEAGEKKLNRWLRVPGWMVVTCQRATSNGDEPSMLDPMSLAREDYAACCCAIQNFCLSLHANGMGTKWTTGPVNFDHGFADAVGFSPNEEYVVGTIWFGTPASEPTIPVKKLAMEDVLIRHT
jgi:nitroreductase